MVALGPAEQLEREIGERLRAARLRRQWRQVDLAREANVSEGAVKHIESGKGATLRSFTRVCVALGATDWLDALAAPQATVSPLAALRAAKQAARPRRVRASKLHGV